MVKCLSTMQETQVRSLGWEDPLEKEMAIHSSTIAWKISWTEEPGRLQTVHGVAKSWTRLSDFTSPTPTYKIILRVKCELQKQQGVKYMLNKWEFKKR